MERYGRTLDEWNVGIKVATAILGSVAKAERTITYSDLAAKLAAPRVQHQ